MGAISPNVSVKRRWASSTLPAAPFLLYSAFSAVHYPMHAPQKYLDRFPISGPGAPDVRRYALRGRRRDWRHGCGTLSGPASETTR